MHHSNRFYHFWTQHRRHILISLSAIILLSGLGIWGIQNRQVFSAQMHQTAPRPVTSRQITQRRHRVHRQLTTYLQKVTHDGTTSVSFRNLAPVPGSPAAKDSLTHRFYRPGSLDTAANAHTPEVSASTYKLFVAAYLDQLNHQGVYTWTPENLAGLQEMIVHSENDFAEDVLDQYGLEGINGFIASQHWYSPVFVAGDASQTTAASLAALLTDLANQRGAFRHASDQQRLLKLMHQQVYRTGIPAGAAQAQRGTQVADKVGWFADTNNDAGIVTLPNGQRYVLVILTHGHQQTDFSGFPRIAKITRHIQKLVYDPQLLQHF